MRDPHAVDRYRGQVMLSFDKADWNRYMCRTCGMITTDIGRFRHYRWHRDSLDVSLAKMAEIVDALFIEPERE